MVPPRARQSEVPLPRTSIWRRVSPGSQRGKLSSVRTCRRGFVRAAPDQVGRFQGFLPLRRQRILRYSAKTCRWRNRRRAAVSDIAALGLISAYTTAAQHRSGLRLAACASSATSVPKIQSLIAAPLPCVTSPLQLRLYLGNACPSLGHDVPGNALPQSSANAAMALAHI